MANFIAEPARIRRLRREAEFARFVDPAVLVTSPQAQDGFQDVRESFFSVVADAQFFLDELADNALALVRKNEAAETAEPLRLGTDVPLEPVLPQVQMKDRLAGLDRAMIAKGISIDHHTQRNSVETTG